MLSDQQERDKSRFTLLPGLEATREHRYHGAIAKYSDEERRKLVTPGNELFYRFEKTARFWLVSLNDYTDEQFARKPDAAQWSIGEIYHHLVVGTENFHVPACRKCLEHQADIVEGGKSFPGKIVFLLGGFPPAKIHVPPSPQYTPKQPQSRAEMRDGLLKLIEEMRALAPQIDHASPVQKSRHPALGMLNAMEWYRLIEMHFRHHLRQKARLDKFLARSA